MISPLGALSVTIVLGGAPVQSYNHPYLHHGRVMAPVVPFVTRCADRIGYSGKMMVIQRGDRVARQPTGVIEPQELQAYYVAVAPLLRALGAQVSYDAAARKLFVRCMRAAPLRTPAPNEQRGPRVVPTTVLTPEPVVTPRPAFSGSPHPRRTPIVVTTSRP